MKGSLILAAVMIVGMAAPLAAQSGGNVDRGIAPNYSNDPAQYQTAQAGVNPNGQQYPQPGAPVQIQRRDPQDFRQPIGVATADPRRQSPPPPPFTLTPDQQAEVDQVLDQWESMSGKVKTFKCDFDRMKYDPAFLPPVKGEERPISVSKGELKFVAPDKGLMEETELQALAVNPKTQRQEVVKRAHGEHWICDGKSLFQIDHEKQTATETPIPPEMQGQAITQGPLPFVFGAKKLELKARYYIRTVTPADDKINVWLEIIPKYMRDAQNFVKAQVILRKSDMFPSAVQLYPTTNGEHEVFILKEKSWISTIFSSDTFKPPFGYKLIPNQMPGAPPPQAGGAAAPADNGQARRPNMQPVYRQ